MILIGSIFLCLITVGRMLTLPDFNGLKHYHYIKHLPTNMGSTTLKSP